MLDIFIASDAAQRDRCYLLRIAVFVRGQGVPMSMELDDHDETEAIHFLSVEEGKDVATARLLIRGDKAKVQRVAVSRTVRGRGHGHTLMQTVIEHAKSLDAVRCVVLDSQLSASEFYAKLGFVAEGDPFDDAGIAHICMRLAL
ncbi:MAG: GNAT family N-acetyltransferase [Ahrensia sp.]|nr:GNAT family N-acetyltransferase [Ahrensia sp.]